MSDENEKPQIKISESTVVHDQAAAISRIVVLVISSFAAISHFVAVRDLAAFIAFMQSSDGIGFIALVVSGATAGWAWWKTRHRAKQVVSVAEDVRVPEQVITFK